jgi:hypothetical protein
MVAYYGVNFKHIPPAGGAANIPVEKARGLTPRIDKQNIPAGNTFQIWIIACKCWSKVLARASLARTFQV